MTALTNKTLLQVTLPYLGYPVLDDAIFVPAVATQNGAHPVRGEAVRITAVPVDASSMILREGDAGSASPLTFVINDSPNHVLVFAAAGESLNGALNGSISIAASQSAWFMRVPRSSGAAVPDWRAGVIS
jgi:hypothetical protein